MAELFRDYWWLVFPLGWFVAAGWTSWLNYRSRKDALRLIQTYADKGQPAPPELLRVIERSGEDDDDCKPSSGSSTNWGWYQVALFGGLAAGFVWMANANLLGDEGLGDAMLVAAVILAALALASLVGALTHRRPRT